MSTQRYMAILGVAVGLLIAFGAALLPSCGQQGEEPFDGQPVSVEQAEVDLEKKATLEAKQLDADREKAKAEAEAAAAEREEAARLATLEQERVLAAAKRELTRETGKVEAARAAAIAELSDAFALKADASAAAIEAALRDITKVHDARVLALQTAFAELERAAAERQANWESEIAAARERDAARWAVFTTIKDVAAGVVTGVAGPQAGAATEGLGSTLLAIFGLASTGFAVKKARDEGKASKVATAAIARKQELDMSFEKVVDSIDDIWVLLDEEQKTKVKELMRIRQGDKVTAVVQSVRNHIKASDALATDDPTSTSSRVAA